MKYITEYIVKYLTANKDGKLKIGIGSYAFRYAIGGQDFALQTRMETEDFINTAGRLGYGGVQLCENLQYEDYSSSRLADIGKLAKSLGLFIELGMRELTKERLFKHIDIARKMEADFLRVVVGDYQPLPEAEPDRLTDETIILLKEALPRLKDAGISVGIENHFDLPNESIAQIVRMVADPHIGTVVDTTNCLGFLSTPEETFEMLGPYILSLHVKDYEIRKVEGGYFIEGVPLGKGQANPETLIRKTLAHNPHASIILEISQKRDSDRNLHETIEWETEQVRENTEAFFKIMKKFSPNRDLSGEQNRYSKIKR